jgi:hypothetical protein
LNSLNFHKNHLLALLRFALGVLLSFYLIPLYAVPIAAIELGSTGVKGRVIEVNRSADTSLGIQYQVLFRKDINAGIIDGATNQELTEEGIERGVAAVQQLIGEMKQFDPARFVMVASTSFDNYRNRLAFQNALEKATGYPVKFITTDDEIFYALKTSISKKMELNSLLIDVGSGNFKIGYHHALAKNKFESFRVEIGSASIRDRAVQMGGDYEQAVRAVLDRDIRPELRKKLLGHGPVFSPRRIILLEGGAPWVAATFAKPQSSKEQYTRLERGDIAKSRIAMRATTASTDSLLPEAVRDQNEILESSKLGYRWAIAGSMLLEVILDEINARDRPVIFNRFTGWILGYAISDYEQSLGPQR